MILNGGQYGGHFFFSPQTIQKFTKRFSQSTRRGLGFDMKELDESKTINMSELASEETFGHLGFTGCAAFADPKYDLIYIFLSNRTYPSMRNNKLGRNDYRPRIQSKIYESILQQFNT
jgi:CubicO group peptidase (beta-lactamase class C family)